MSNYRSMVLFSLVLLLSFYGIAISGFWKDKLDVKNIEIRGNVTVSKDDLFNFAKITDSMIYGNVLSLQAIESRLLKHPNVRDVSVSRDGEVINITIVEKSPFAIITNGRKMLMADHNFTVYEMKKRPDSEIDLPVISGFSDEISPGIFAKDDLEKLKIGYFIVSTAANISKVLYSFISEIDFTSPEHIKIITSDDASVIYLVDYDILLNDAEHRQYINKQNYKDELLKRKIAVKLSYLYAFLNQVKLYKPFDSYDYIDMRYNDVIAVKQKTK